MSIKFVFIFLLLSYSSQSSTSKTSECDSDLNSTGLSECKKLKVSSEDKYCCFVNVTYVGTNLESNICYGISEKEYKYLDDIAAEAEKKDGVKSYKIECTSNFLIVSIVCFIGLLVF